MSSSARGTGEGRELDDTIIVPVRAVVPNPTADTDDTIIRTRETLDHQPDTAASQRAIVPAFYRLRIGGAIITLDRPAYIGRRPSLPRLTPTPEPRLVRVASPLREVSATHLEVCQLGSSIIITDLHSTNGSTVLIPGRTARLLGQGDSLVVSPGTLVDIGDQNVLQILPTR